MTSAELRTLPAEEAATLPPALHALWQDAHGDWTAAHSLVDELETREACRVHAYLHRKEGNQANAAHWYSHIGQPPFAGSLPDEWTTLAEDLLKSSARNPSASES